ncbi:hypothetical protein ACLKA7_016329 [Drosophila subpalustris]
MNEKRINQRTASACIRAMVAGMCHRCPCHMLPLLSHAPAGRPLEISLIMTVKRATIVERGQTLLDCHHQTVYADDGQQREQQQVVEACKRFLGIVRGRREDGQCLVPGSDNHYYSATQI